MRPGLAPMDLEQAKGLAYAPVGPFESGRQR